MSGTAEEHRVFTRNLHHRYPVIERAEGIYLYDTEGNRYLDGCSGSLVANLGHGNRRVAARLARQAEAVGFTHGSRFLNRPAISLARRLADAAPGDLSRAYLVSGGSEAVETAIKMARQYFQERDGAGSARWKVIGRDGDYHGATLGALGVTGHEPRRRRYHPMLPDFPRAAACYCYRCPFGLTHPGCGLACAADLERVIREEGPETVAAVIIEPVVGAASGAVVPPDGYLQAVREICDRHDVLVIADEVMTGCGRTGAMFAVDHWGVVPDLLCVAKGLSAGYAPLGAVLVRRPIAEAFRRGSGRFTHGHTYAGNPLSAAAGDEVLRILNEEDLVGRSREMGNYLLRRLRAALRRYPWVGDVRGIGLMAGVELVQDRASRQPFPTGWQVAERFTLHALERGVVVYPGGGMLPDGRGDHFLVGPPLTITREQVDELVTLLARSCDSFAPAMAAGSDGP